LVTHHHNNHTTTNLNYQAPSLSNSNLQTGISASDSANLEFPFNNTPQQFRGRASSEPATSPMKINTTKSVFSHQQQDMTSQFPKMCPSPAMSTDQFSVKSENMEDIMDIIGELSSPNQRKEELSEYNSCFYDNKQQQQQQQPQQQPQQKQFNSIPDNMNLLSSSPSQNYLNNSFYTGNNTSSNNTAYNTNSNHTTPYNNTSAEMRQSPSNFLNNPAVLSPTDDPMELDRFPSSNNTLNWMEDNSITFQGVSPKEQYASNLSMASHNGFEFNSTNNSIASNPQALYESQTRSQTSILYRSSPKPQDGFVSLFDLEGPEY